MNTRTETAEGERFGRIVFQRRPGAVLRIAWLWIVGSIAFSLCLLSAAAQTTQETAVISAVGNADGTIEFYGEHFAPNEAVSVFITKSGALYGARRQILGRWAVMADVAGRVEGRWYTQGLTETVNIRLLGRSSLRQAQIDISLGDIVLVHTAHLDQCRNGTFAVPLICTGANWDNGNLNGSQAHYVEGESVPYRILFENLSVGPTHTVTIEFDSTQSGKHALDYLTAFDRTELDADPCSGVASCNPFIHSHWPIPADPAVAAGQDGIAGNGDDIAQAAGAFTLFGGTILSASGYTVSGSYAGNSQTSITVTFTTTVSDPVFAWGGHIATRQDWGVGNSAIAISGAPFHMRILDVDGEGGGNQDRGLQSDAVIFPGTIIITKDSQPNSVADFWYDAIGPAVSGFWLDDDGDPAAGYSNVQTFSGLTSFGSGHAVTITEASSPWFALTSIVCTSDSQGGQGSDNNVTSVPTRQAVITLEEGELVACTFVNAFQTSAEVTVSGRVLNADGGGVTNATVTLMSPDGLATTVITGRTGSFTFGQVVGGRTYAISVNSGRFQYLPRAILVEDNISDLIFRPM